MPRIKKSDNKLGQIINFYEHVPKKYLEDVAYKSKFIEICIALSA